MKYGKDFATPERIGAYPPILKEGIDKTQKLEAVWKIRIED